MRFYSIKNKITGQYITGLQWRTGKKRGQLGDYTISTDDTPRYQEIDNLNYLIQSLIERKLHSALDDCEIETFERVYVSIKSSIKMKTVRNRIEKREIIKKLKG